MSNMIRLPNSQRPYKGLIPTHRSVCGADLMDLRARLGMDLSDTLWVLAIQQSRLSQLIGKNQHIPLRNASRTFLVRLLDEAIERKTPFRSFPLHLMQYPIPFPRPPSVPEYFKQCEICGVSPMVGVIMLGLTIHSLKRWNRAIHRNQPVRISPVLERLMLMLYLEMFSRGKEAVMDHLNRLRIEANARQADLHEIIAGEASWYDIFEPEES